MKRILITGAGGTPSTNFVRSLRESGEDFYLIGIDCNEYFLQRAETDEKHLIPNADDPYYLQILRTIIQETHAELIYSQPDQEIFQISKHRANLGIRTFLPKHQTIEICQNKFESFRCWELAGLKVPKTILIRDGSDLKYAFDQFKKPIWLRAITSPGGGKGSFRAENVDIARTWIEFCEGWGKFTAAQCLEINSVTWTSLWSHGKLIVAQGRKRLYWEFGDRVPSGVTGLTGTGITVADSIVDELALHAIHAIDKQPHGIFAVDFTYDSDGIPNPTEINIGRFFTTHLFFTRAGLNMPHIFVKLAFDEKVPMQKVNPLPTGLAWIRGMDFLPILTDIKNIIQSREELAARREKIMDKSESANKK